MPKGKPFTKYPELYADRVIHDPAKEETIVERKSRRRVSNKRRRTRRVKPVVEQKKIDVESLIKSYEVILQEVFNLTITVNDFLFTLRNQL